MNNLAETRRDYGVAVVRVEILRAVLIGVDLDAEGLFDRGHGALQVDRQAIGKTFCDREALAIRPIHHGLFILSRGGEPCIPLIRSEELMEGGGAFGLHILEKLLLFRQAWRLET